MRKDRYWIVALVMVLGLLPAGAQATAPADAPDITFGAGNDVVGHGDQGRALQLIAAPQRCIDCVSRLPDAKLGVAVSREKGGDAIEQICHSRLGLARGVLRRPARSS